VKKKVIKIVGILLIGVIIGASVEKGGSWFKTQTARNANMSEYESTVKDFVDVSDKELFDESSDFSGLVYIGRKTCEDCQVFVPVLRDLTIEKTIPIYYFDTDKYRDSKNFNRIIKKYDIGEVPDVIYINTDKTYERFSIESVKDGKRFDQWILEKGLEEKEKLRKEF